MSGSRDGVIDESLRRRFETAWEAGKPASIDDFLPPESDPQYLAALEQWAGIELEVAWKSWNRLGRGASAAASAETIHAPPSVESYLQRFPRLNRPDIVARLVRRERSIRTACGQPGTIEEYRRRFPDTTLDPCDLAPGGLETREFGPSEPEVAQPMRASAATVAETLALGSSGASAGEETLSQRFGNYELLEEIGRGGMGIVYRARQRDANRIVALKVIRRDRLESMPRDTQATAVDRFHTEAQAAAQLEHDHIVTVYEVGEVAGQAFFSMRYVEGRSLSEILHDGPIANRRAAQYMEPVVRAVQEAHRLGILHRDLKPQNILVEAKTDRAMVADFGLAKFTGGGEELTRAGEVMGTPQYMSPEQAKDSAAVTAASDIYALGATLYHIVTGRPPFQAATPVETLRQVIDELPAAPRQVNPSVDRDLDTICMKCLQKEPARRYATAELLAGDLARYLRGEPILARPVGIAERAWRWCRRNPVVAASGAMAAMFLVLALVATSVGYVKTSAALAKSEASQKELERGVEEFFGAVMDETLLNEPGMIALRRKLGKSALPYYERFLEDRQDDPAIRDKLALAHYRVGNVNEMMDTPEQALVAYRRAREIQERLARERPNDVERLQGLGETLNTIGMTLYGKLKRRDDARRVFEEALAVRERLVAAAPGVDAYRRKVANAQMNLGLIEMESGRLQEAAERFTAAHKVHVGLMAKNARDPETLRDLGVSYFNLANLAVRKADYTGAEKSFARAIDAFERSLALEPKSLESAWKLAVCCQLLADIKWGTGKREVGLALYMKAIRLLKTLADGTPAVSRYRADLAGTYMQLGAQESMRGRYREATESLDEARRLLEKLVVECPSVPEYRYNLSRTLAQLGRISMAGGGNTIEAGLSLCGDAAGRLEKLVTEKPDVADYRLDLATLYMDMSKARYAQTRYRDAIRSAERARKLFEGLVKQRPDSAADRLDLTSALVILGRSRLANGEVQSARDALETATRHAEELVKRNPGEKSYAQRLASIEKRLADVKAEESKKH